MSPDVDRVIRWARPVRFVAPSRFLKERFGPALEAVGFAGPRPEPQFWPVHNYMK